MYELKLVEPCFEPICVYFRDNSRKSEWNCAISWKIRELARGTIQNHFLHSYGKCQLFLHSTRSRQRLTNFLELHVCVFVLPAKKTLSCLHQKFVWVGRELLTGTLCVIQWF